MVVIEKLDYTEFGDKPVVTALFDNGKASFCKREHLGDRILVKTVLDDIEYILELTNTEYWRLTKRGEINVTELELKPERFE